MARVITARRPDTCRGCSQPIAAGERINYGGYGAVTHEACPPMDAPGASAHNGYRAPRAYRRGSRYAYTSSGARVTMSSRRCEDAPCCGCCD